jgi:hypothetical protein
MMNVLKKLYRDFFGLTEQTSTTTSAKPDPTKDVVLSAIDAKDPKKVQAAQNILKTTKGRIHIEEESEMMDEAQLINNIIDYRGGVEYVLRNPAEAEAVANEIREWATKKGFTVVKHESSPSGKVGYFYFRLGQDPARESQRIQGYIAQKPEIKHFRFNVRGEKKPATAPQQPAPENI